MKYVKDGRFSVKLFYLLLTPARDLLFPSLLIWNPWVPTKVGFFAWEASWGYSVNPRPTKEKGESVG